MPIRAVACILLAACGGAGIVDLRPGPAPAASVAEANQLGLPPWARLVGVLGSYDMQHPGAIAARFSDDAAFVVSLSGDDGTLRVFDVTAQALVRVVPPCAPAKRRGGSLDVVGSLAITGDGDGTICMRDWTHGTVVRTWQAHAAPIQLVAVSRGHIVSYAHQKRVVAEAQIGPIVEQQEAGGEARVWTLGGARLGEYAIGDSDAIAVSRDGALAFARASELRVIDPDDGHVLWRRQLAECSWQCVHALGFSGDGTLVGAVDSKLASIDASGVRAFAFTGFWGEDSYAFTTLAVSRDGKAFAVHEQGFVTHWNVGARREVNDEHRGMWHADGAAYSADGTRLVTWTQGVLRVWHDGPAVHAPDPRPAGHQHPITRIAVAGDRVLTIAGQDLEARLWDPGARRTLARWDVTRGDGDLSSDGALAVTIGANETAEVRDVATGEVRWRIPARTRGGALRFSPDSKRLVSQGDEHHELLSVHDAHTGQLIASWGHGAYDARPVLAITGDRVVALDERHRLARWTLDGKPLGTDDGEPDPRDFASDAAGAVAVTRGQYLALHDLASGTSRSFAAGGWYGLAMTANDEVFASQYNGSVHRYAKDGRDLGAIELGPTHDRATALALSRDGGRLYIGTERGVVLVIDLAATI